MSDGAPDASTALIGVEALRSALSQAVPPVVLDTSFDLADAGAGERDHAAAHIPGAFHLHLERDLSGAKVDPQGRFRGRHPLPAIADLAATVGACGIGPATRVVVVDRQGSMMAARAWWLLRWLGHRDVSVLDGGMQAWIAAGGELASGPVRRLDSPAYPAGEPARPTIDADGLRARLGQLRLFDARAGERFRGEVEPLDNRAGHIPGARNRFFKDNLRPDGHFKPAAQLHAEWLPLLAGQAATDVVHSCGSGVTACHNLLAMEIAGLHGSVLYPGSWSEWSADPTRPVATG